MEAVALKGEICYKDIPWVGNWSMTSGWSTGAGGCHTAVTHIKVGYLSNITADIQARDLFLSRDCRVGR